MDDDVEVSIISKSSKRPQWRPPSPNLAPESTFYGELTDEELLDERDRQRTQLDELMKHPGSSPAIRELLASISGDVEQMTGELHRRARLRHPASRSLRARKSS